MPRRTSPSPISLAQHLVEFGVGPELPDLLCTAVSPPRARLGIPGSSEIIAAVGGASGQLAATLLAFTARYSQS
jgi:hypothetical protein